MSTSAPATDYLDYVELTFTTDEQALADAAVVSLQASWPDWQPNDGDVEVVLIETLAPFATAAAQQASQMPPEAFVALGTKLYGIAIEDGVPASTTVTLTFQDAVGGYLVPAGSEFELSGFAFSTALDVTSAAGSNTAPGVEVVANDVGAAFNDLTDSEWASVTLPVFVTNLATEAPTAGGVDPQTTDDYLNMLSRELQMRGRMIVTLPDFELTALDQQGVGRAYAQTLGPRQVAVTLTDDDGNAVSSSIKADLQAIYQAAVLANVTFTFPDATYTEIDIAYTVRSLPGFDPTQLVASIDEQLTTALSPLNYGAMSYASQRSYSAPYGVTGSNWVNDPTIRLNAMIALVGGVAGVQYVEALTINGAAADYTMPGTVALPTPGTFTGTVDVPALA